MQTIIGTAIDSLGRDKGVTIQFVSASTGQVAGQVVTLNTTRTIASNPVDGTFSITLEQGVYQVTFGSHPATTSFTISVPSGTGTLNFGDIVTSAIPPLPSVIPATLWNGTWAGSFVFVPIYALIPTVTQVAYTGGNINAAGGEKYAYWVSYVNAVGETIVSAQVNVAEGGSPTANLANRVTFGAMPAGATTLRLWRTYVDTGSTYVAATFPANVSLLATMAASTAYYDDFESTAAFLAREPGTVPPTYNTTAGKVYSSAGNLRLAVTDTAVEFPGTTVRVDPVKGLQVYNLTTKLWYSIICTGALGAEQVGIDAGNPN